MTQARSAPSFKQSAERSAPGLPRLKLSELRAFAGPQRQAEAGDVLGDSAGWNLCPHDDRRDAWDQKHSGTARARTDALAGAAWCREQRSRARDTQGGPGSQIPPDRLGHGCRAGSTRPGSPARGRGLPVVSRGPDLEDCTGRGIRLFHVSRAPNSLRRVPSCNTGAFHSTPARRHRTRPTFTTRRLIP